MTRWLRVAAFVLCFGLFARTLAHANLRAAWERIRDVGPIELVIVVPFLFVMMADVWAWQRLLRALGRRVALHRLLRVRFATEAITNTIPAGAVWADALGPVLVSMSTGVAVADVFAASTAKRWVLVRMHSAYVACAAAFGSAAIMNASMNLIGSHALVAFVLLASLGLVLSSLGIEAVASRGRIAERTAKLLGRMRLSRVQAWVDARHHHFAHADAQLRRLSEDVTATRDASFRLAFLWLLEGFETFLILRLLGAPLSLIEVMSFDAALSVVRSVAFFAPAGIGVQDVGYLAVLEAYGVPGAHAIGPAFIVLKRMKEAFWVLIGFAVLATMRKRKH
ncbi:MAG: flippase-like domain-containing protein [Polyangiaceae bacterium]|nr:flippase-like domain-containing protein [Polyangiaceae bacterium]